MFKKYEVVQAARAIKTGPKTYVNPGCRGVVESSDGTHARVLFAGRRAAKRVPVDALAPYNMSPEESLAYARIMGPVL